MNNSCDIIKDLLPLYIENLTTEESNHLVEHHIAQCTECHLYYEEIKQDYEERINNRSDQNELKPLLSKLANYQQKIKLFGVLTAMLMACIITGASVQFLVTLPLLIIIPFICRLYYDKSMPIIAASIPFALIGGLLSEEHISYIPLFTVITLILTCIGVGAGILVKLGTKQFVTWRKWGFVLPSIAVLVLSSSVYFSFFGNPIGYITTMIKVNQYVNQTYEEGTLTFKGVSYNFKDNRHFGQFEYVLNGVRQTVPIGFYAQGEVNDYYKFVLETQFGEERATDLRTDFAAAIDFMPTVIHAMPEEELQITHNELNNMYYHLSYDLEKRSQATVLRKSEAEKLQYEIYYGEFMDEPISLSKEQFMEKSLALFHALQDQDTPFSRIEIKSLDLSGQLQSVQFQRGATERSVIDSYKLELEN